MWVLSSMSKSNSDREGFFSFFFLKSFHEKVVSKSDQFLFVAYVCLRLFRLSETLSGHIICIFYFRVLKRDVRNH